MVNVKLGFEDSDFRSEEGRSLLSLVFQCPVRLYWLVVKCKFSELRFDPNCSYSVKLTHIMLSGSEFEVDSIQILEKIPNLRVLYLLALGLQGAEMVCCATGFLQLKELHLLYLINLDVWKVEQGAMPLLSNLRILECSNLKMLQDQLRFLKNLNFFADSLDAYGVPGEVWKS